MPVYFWRSAGAAYRDLPEYGDRLQYARGNDNGYTQAANDFRHVQQPCESYCGKRHRRSDGSAHSNALRACLRCSVGSGGADCARVRKAAAEQHQQVHVQLGRSDIGDRNSGSDDKCTMMG